MTLFSSSAFPLPWASGCWECLAEPNTPPLADPCSYIAWPEPNRRSRNVRPTNSKTVPTECFVNIVLFLALPPHSLNTLFLQCIFVHWDMSLVWRPLSKLWRLFLWVYRPDCFEQILILRRHGGYLWLKACKKKSHLSTVTSILSEVKDTIRAPASNHLPSLSFRVLWRVLTAWGITGRRPGITGNTSPKSNSYFLIIPVWLISKPPHNITWLILDLQSSLSFYLSGSWQTCKSIPSETGGK